ncbi:MAG: GumC family protein [Acidobacteriota bacterium]
MDERPQREMHLTEYWHILRKRRWVVITSVTVLFTTVTVGSFLITPTYKSTAVMQIERHTPDIVDFRDMYTRDSSTQAYIDFYQTQYKLIESRDVLRQVIERLDLPNAPAMVEAARPGHLAQGLAWVRGLLPGAGIDEATATDPFQHWVNVVADSTDVRPVRNSHLVEISFVSTDPTLARDVANAIADEYKIFNAAVKSRTTGLAGKKLDSEVTTLDEDIKLLDEQLRDFGTHNSILDLGNRKTLALSTLEELTRAATQARVSRARRQASFESLRDADPESLEVVLNSPVIKELKGRLTDLQRQYAEKTGLFKPDYPDMLALKSQMDVVGTQLDDEIARIREQVVGGAETAYRTALNEEQRLAGLEEGQKSRLREMEQSFAEYENLKANLDAKKEMRAGLIKRRDETGVLNRVDDIKAGNVWLAQAAEIPANPYRPNKKLNILLSLFVGVALGVGLAFFFEYLDNSVKGADDLEQGLGLSALGMIPAMRRRGHGKVVALDSGGRAIGVELVTHDAPKSNHAEAYRDLRTTLLLSSPDQPPRVIMVTSSQPREGKTVTTLNVAVSLTQVGKKVLIVDADMRKPRVHKILDLPRKTGLSSWLAGTLAWADIVHTTRIAGLSAITSGPIPPNPAELLASKNFRTLLHEAHEHGAFDHIVVDTPPVLAVSDPVIVSALADGVLLVVQGGQTARQSVAVAMDKLKGANARVLGAVLNNLDLGGNDYYSYRYGYRYGYYTHHESELQAEDDRPGASGAGGRTG